MINILDANSLYLSAKAFTKSTIEELGEKWNEPLINAVKLMLLQVASSNPAVGDILRSDPRTAELFEGVNNAKYR